MVATPPRVQRLAELLARHRRWVWLASALVAIVSAVLASQLPLQGDFATLLPPDAQSVKQLHAIERRVPVPSTFMLGIESSADEHIASVKFDGTLRVDGQIERVSEVWNLSKPVRGGGWVLAGIQQLA